MAASTDANPVSAADPSPKSPRGPLRTAAGGFVVVDDAQNRADASAFLSSQPLVAAGRVDEALAVLRPLAQAPETTVRAHAAVVAAALLTSRGVAGAAEALAFIDRIPASAAVDQGLVCLMRAQALRRLGRADDAIAAARASCAHGVSAERLVVLACSQRLAQRLDEAIATLVRARGAAPDDVTVLGHLAGYLALAGQPQESDAAMSPLRAVVGSAETPEGLRALALALACRQMPGPAQRALDAALAVEPMTTRAWFEDDDLLASRGLTLR